MSVGDADDGGRAGRRSGDVIARVRRRPRPTIIGGGSGRAGRDRRSVTRLSQPAAGYLLATLPRSGDGRAYTPGVGFPRIAIDPGRMNGLPCIRDTRVTVSAVLGQLAAGRSFDEVLADYPYLVQEDLLAALEFAAAALQERELPLAHPA